MDPRLRPQIGYPMVRRAINMGGPVAVPRNLPAITLEPSQPGALGPESGMSVRLPGANYPPAGATPVDEVGDANIAAGSTSLLLSVTVPDTQRFRMAAIGFGADDETALAFLTWSINAPDPIPGYVQKSAAVGTIQNLTEIFVLSGSSVTVSVFGTASALAGTISPGVPVSYRFYARVRGWFYTEKEAS